LLDLTKISVLFLCISMLNSSRSSLSPSGMDMLLLLCFLQPFRPTQPMVPCIDCQPRFLLLPATWTGPKTLRKLSVGSHPVLVCNTAARLAAKVLLPSQLLVKFLHPVESVPLVAVHVDNSSANFFFYSSFAILLAS